MGEQELMADIKLSDELRQKASQKPTFNILYVGDGTSWLSLFRGNSLLKTFSEFYKNQANITFMTAPSSKLANLTLPELQTTNILWIDNVCDFKSAHKLSDLNQMLLELIDKNWRKTASDLQQKNPDEATAYMNSLIAKRSEKLKIVYALDEFVWEAPVGRAHDIQSVQLVETFLGLADTIVVPTAELKESINYYRFANNPDKDIAVIPSGVDIGFFPLFKNFSRTAVSSTQLSDKPKVLIKGLAIPKNVEEFILENYKKMDITISSVDEVNEHIMGLIQQQKVKHIYHWANPYVNKSNMLATWSIERDQSFDFVIHTKPDNLVGNLYEVTTGDDDILFSIAYGAIPISGVNHLGYDEDSSHLSQSCGLSFGKDTTAKALRELIGSHQVAVKWNEVYNNCRSKIEHRLVTAPYILSRYFAVLLGRELSFARAQIANEINTKMESAPQAEATPTTNANVIQGNFKGTQS